MERAGASRAAGWVPAEEKGRRGVLPEPLRGQPRLSPLPQARRPGRPGPASEAALTRELEAGSRGAARRRAVPEEASPGSRGLPFREALTVAPSQCQAPELAARGRRSPRAWARERRREVPGPGASPGR